MSADAIARLVARLDAGEAKIRAAEREGKDVTDWENLWLAILSEYERAVDSQRQTVQGALFASETGRRWD